MPILTHDDILQIHQAIVSAQLVGSRSTLLGGIDGHFVAGLPYAANPSDQILEDLHALNNTGALADGSVPLVLWLKNAAARAGDKREGVTFRDALARCEEAVASGRSTLQARSIPSKVGGQSAMLLQIAASPGTGAIRASDGETFHYARALKLIRTKLPRVLASISQNPRALVLRAGIDIPVMGDYPALDQWTFICEALAGRNVMGIAETFRLVDEAQNTVFSETVSGWAAKFVDTLLQDNGGSGDSRDNLTSILKSFVRAETARWSQLEEQVAQLSDILGQEDHAYAQSMLRAWASVTLVLMGLDDVASQLTTTLQMESEACELSLSNVHSPN